MLGILYDMNGHTQYFILEKYEYFCDILIKIKLYTQNIQPKIHLDVVIRVGDNRGNNKWGLLRRRQGNCININYKQFPDFMKFHKDVIILNWCCLLLIFL